MKLRTRGQWVLSCATALSLLLSACGNNSSSTAPYAGGPCTPDVPMSAGLLTSPPTDIGLVAGVEPVGHLNPGGNHVLPSDHMYLDYLNPAGGGSDSIPVHAMAAGNVFMIFRQQVSGRPDFDYQIFIRHTCSVYSYFDHVHLLATDLNQFLTDNSAQWRSLSGGASGPWLVFLGQAGGPPVFPVTSGQQVGTTKNYSSSWDVGLVDTRQQNGVFVNPDVTHYPSYTLLPTVFPGFGDVDMSIYHMDNKTVNSACFINYMDNSAGMQTAWRNKLNSTYKGCGHTGWDIPGTLRGEWFNPALYTLSGPTLDNEVAAFSIVPDDRDPDTRVDFAMGNASNGTTVPSLALLDPGTWSPPISAPQLQTAFQVDFDAAAVPDSGTGQYANPDPAAVSVGTTSCYDLPYSGGNYNTLWLYLSDMNDLYIKYDPTALTSPACAGLISTAHPVDSSWILYTR